jgi:hypothetical protein
LKHWTTTQSLSKRAKKFISQRFLNRISNLNLTSHSSSSIISIFLFLSNTTKMHKYPKTIKELSLTSNSLSSKCMVNSNTCNNKHQINSINNSSSKFLRVIIHLKGSNLEASKFLGDFLLPWLLPCIPRFSSNSTNRHSSNLLTLKWPNSIHTGSNFSENCLTKNTKRF